MKPTKARVKKFWEKCGVKGKLGYIEDIGEKEGKLVYVSPPIDLNNLFKYAWDLAIDTLMNTQGLRRTQAKQRLFDIWQHCIEEGNSSEDALFWAIYEAMN